VARMGDSYREFRQPRGPSPTWVGWVTRTDDQFVALLRPDVGSGRLVVLAGDPETGVVSDVELDRTSGGLRLAVDHPLAQTVGSPVCLFPESPEPARTLMLNDPASQLARN
jgi:hypothetical protein